MQRTQISKRKLVGATTIAALTVFFLVFNTSTRNGRWLYWQDSDYGDMDRFDFLLVEPASESIRQFQSDLDADVSELRDLVLNLPIDGNRTIGEFARDNDSTALIVVHGDNLLHEEYFQGNHRQSLQMTFSCTKSIVSLLVGIAIEDGLIHSVDDPISRYVTELNPDFEQVSIRHLMTMTSGIHDSDEKLFGVPAPWSDEVRGYYDPDFRRLAQSFTTTYAPGERFEYHDFNPILVALALERVTGKTLAAYAQERLWRPLGAEFAARWSVDSSANGFAKPESGFNARAIDLARVGAMLIDSDQEVVPVDWIDDSIRDERAAELTARRYQKIADSSLQRGRIDEVLAAHIRALRYGFFWWGVERDGRYDFYANGHLGQFIYVSPQADLVIVRNGKSHGDSDDFEFADIFFRMASAVIEHQSKFEPN